ncbi:MAG: hypothetical protein ABIT07_03405 [Ferruginibacter sp.]
MILIKKIRILIVFFIIALAVSGITAFPVETEIHWLLSHPSLIPTGLQDWLQRCYMALQDTNMHYPMLAYGYDWLGFAHLVIAIAFIGPYLNPVKNKWIIDWAILACIAIVPLAFIAGPIRYIPVFHILIDCSFGVLGLIPLIICRSWIKLLEKQNNQQYL